MKRGGRRGQKTRGGRQGEKVGWKVGRRGCDQGMETPLDAAMRWVARTVAPSPCHSVTAASVMKSMPRPRSRLRSGNSEPVRPISRPIAASGVSRVTLRPLSARCQAVPLPPRTTLEPLARAALEGADGEDPGEPFFDELPVDEWAA